MQKWNGEDTLNPNYITWWETKKEKLYLSDLVPCNDLYTVKKIVVGIEDNMMFYGS